MTSPKQRGYVFGRYDLITINGVRYRYNGKINDQHQLQWVNGNVLDTHFDTFSDEDIAALMARGAFKLDEEYFSKAVAEMRQRQDTDSLIDLNEEQLRDLTWKQEWVERFGRAREDETAGFRPKLTHNDIALFIERERESMDRWYLRRYGERRRAGRPVLATDENLQTIKVRKPFDYPSPTALRNWLRRYRRANERSDGFKPQYHRCGRHAQLPDKVESIVAREVKRYAGRNRPAKSDIVENVMSELLTLNGPREKAGLPKYSVNRTTIYRRIDALNPFQVDVGRIGSDRAMRKHQPTGRGINVRVPLKRIEIDDWDVDLQVLLVASDQWKKLSRKQRAAVQRVRPTLTIAIDCATRCIVGFNLSETAASTPAAKAAFRSILRDKTPLAKFAGAQTDWPMAGLPHSVYSDGGSVFDNKENRTALRQARINHVLPEQDPRKRGTIEAFFRYFKRACRYHAGQTFANVVQKADYPSEAMASMTYEAFYKFCIRFIVDYYHNRPHRGLEQRTPANAWREATEKYSITVPSARQAKIAFGFRREDVTLDKHGVLFANLSYNSADLAALRAMYGDRKKVDLIVDPEDIGSVLVVIPKRFRKAMNDLGSSTVFGDVLEVGCMADFAKGLTLAAYLATQKKVRERVAAENEKGNKIRLEANASFSREARQAARNAGVPDQALTEEGLATVLKEFRRQVQVSLGESPIGEEEKSADIDSFGEEVARSKRTRPTGEANGSSENDQPRPKGKPKKADPKRESQEAIKPQSSSINLYKGRK